MKEIATLLAGLFVLTGLTAKADTVSVKLTVDDASHVTATVYGEPLDIVSGDNNLQVEQYSAIELKGVSPWSLKQVYDNVNNYAMTINSGTCTIYASEGADYNVTTYNADATRTATATINIDDASKVRIMRARDYSSVILQDGTNEFKFDPATETSLMIGAANYSMPLYEVKVNEEPVTASYGTYYVTLTDGCTVDITANIPDKDITVTLAYTDETSIGCVSSVNINGIPLEGFDPLQTVTIPMKAGEQLAISSGSNFKVDDFKVNGITTYFYGTWQQIIMEDTELTFTAHLYGTINATVIVDDPSTIIFGKGAYDVNYGAEIQTLNPGETEIELSENNTQVCWAAANGCFIEKVEIDGIEQGKYISNAQLRAGSVIKFTSGKIVMDKTAVFWIDDKDAVDTYFNLQGQDRTAVNVESGYNEVPFYSGMLPLGLSWYSEQPVVGKVFINGNLASPQYEGSSTYSIDLNDNDVVKIFFAAEPVECTVTFDIEDGLNFSAKTDRITVIESLNNPMTVFAGTELAMLHSTDYEITVTANDAELTPGEEGLYNLTVTGPTAIKAATKVQDDIREISSPAAETESAIFDLQGRRVSKSAKGLLIVNGKKTIVK